MNNIYVLDTNVLLDDPKALYDYENNEVILPLAVLEELDDQKRKTSDIGYNARETSRILDELRLKGRLNEGIELDNNSVLKIVIDKQELKLPPHLSASKADNRILTTAIDLQESNPEKEVIMVSNDINLRLIANAFDIEAEDHKGNGIDGEKLYDGFIEIKTKGSIIDEFYSTNELSLDKLDGDFKELYPHQMIQLSSLDERSKSALGRFDGEKIVPLIFDKKSPMGITALNREQKYAIELLLNDDIKVVTVSGKAGTGKTLLALAAGLQKVINDKYYDRVLIARPVIPMGKDIGFLPGSVEEKLEPWMQPILDNLNLIIHSNKGSYLSIDQLIENNSIQIEALTYIRGRSIPNQYIIIDEAQNLSKHEVKTILTRAGKDSKIILTGDPFQIDNPYLNKVNNGLSQVANHFHKEQIAGHIMLQKGERSEIAKIASDIL
ncbi:MAG TPA: PhoH family protein [Halanaerobiales bacterium]|nr:PhoH family protein [Halanaerobiales bacterium]